MQYYSSASDNTVPPIYSVIMDMDKFCVDLFAFWQDLEKEASSKLVTHRLYGRCGKRLLVEENVFACRVVAARSNHQSTPRTLQQSGYSFVDPVVNLTPPIGNG